MGRPRSARADSGRAAALDSPLPRRRRNVTRLGRRSPGAARRVAARLRHDGLAQFDLWIEPHRRQSLLEGRGRSRAGRSSSESSRRRTAAHATRKHIASPSSGPSRRAGRTGAAIWPGRHLRFRTAGMWSEGEVMCVRETWLGRDGRRTRGTSSQTGTTSSTLWPIGAEALVLGHPHSVRGVDAETERLPGAPPPVRAAGRGLLDIPHPGRKLDASRAGRELRGPCSSDAGRLRLRRLRARPPLLDGRPVGAARRGRAGGGTGERRADRGGRGRCARRRRTNWWAEWPFPTGWEDWRPDPGWEPPSLPAGWDKVGDA